MATIDYKQLATPEANLIELLSAQNQDGTYSAKLMGSEPFAVLAAKTIYNAYNDIEDNMAADVEGPATSTDNALARFDGTTGKLLQNSNAILTDAGALSLASNLTVSGTGYFADVVEVRKSAVSTNLNALTLRNSAYNVGESTSIVLTHGTGSGKPVTSISSYLPGSNQSELVFYTSNTSSVSTEALRINGSQNATFAGTGVTLGSYGGSVDRVLSVLGRSSAAGQTLRLADFSTAYGFDIVNDGATGKLSFVRHENSVSGVEALGIDRASGNATFAGRVASSASSASHEAFRATNTNTAGQVYINLNETNTTATPAYLIRYGSTHATKPHHVELVNGTSNAPITLITSGTAGVNVKGTATNDNAAAGYVGEIITSTVESGSAVSLSNATISDVTSISLTAGDWDVDGNVGYSTSGATVTQFLQGIATASGTAGPTGSYSKNPVSLSSDSNSWFQDAPTWRVSISSTTTIYLIARSYFSAGTVGAYGFLRARRVR